MLDCLFFKMHIIVNIFFFFSSRRRHTRLQGDWSSDVCSSDLDRGPARASGARRGVDQGMVDLDGGPLSLEAVEAVARRGEEARLAPGAARALAAARRFVDQLAESAAPI